MANFEFEYNDADYQLIATSEDALFGMGIPYPLWKDFNQNIKGDYVRLTIYNEFNQVISYASENGETKPAVFYSSLSEIPLFIN